MDGIIWLKFIAVLALVVVGIAVCALTLSVVAWKILKRKSQWGRRIAEVDAKEFDTWEAYWFGLWRCRWPKVLRHEWSAPKPKVQWWFRWLVVMKGRRTFGR